MLLLQNIAFGLPDGTLLFSDINFTVQQYDKIALVGNNGVGKSTLMRIMAGLLLPTSGKLVANSAPYYIPQHFGQYNQLTVAQALNIDKKLAALHSVLAGHMTEANLDALDDDWTIEERCAEALTYWQLGDIDLQRTLGELSGGQKTKVFLAGIAIHQPQLVLMDEPTNHLDAESRQVLYHYIQTTNTTLVIISHDRTLLNLLPMVCQLDKHGITTYGGNYDFYAEQKALAANALAEELRDREKALRKARETERQAIERQQKLDARGKKKQEKAGMPTIMMNTMRNNAEKSTANMKEVHAEKIGSIADEVNRLRKVLPGNDKMKLDLDASALHKGKILAAAKEVNVVFNGILLWSAAISATLVSGRRIAVKGNNGSGKTTLVKLLLGQLQPSEGSVELADFSTVYIDQDYSMVDNRLTVYEQAQHYNTGLLQEHEVKSKLTHFLFNKGDWDKPCAALSGGEKMRLLLCCLTLGNKTPDVIVLDEPTNNLDMQNIEILVNAIAGYSGTLLVISHDAWFLDRVGVQEEIIL